MASVAVPETVWALKRCLDQVDFHRTLLLTDHPPAGTELREIEWRKIGPIQSRESYSEFMLRGLAEHIESPHVLVAQWDGFVLDAGAWREEFVHYDYIGAIWPQFDDKHRVGNGGFSLRSKRLLETTACSDFRGGHPEDLSICRTFRADLEEKGIRFAPEDVAAQFSFERGPRSPSFGFHGAFNFPDVLTVSELREWLRAVDPHLLAGRDGADLVVELARRGLSREAWRQARRRTAAVPASALSLRFWRRLAAASLLPG